MTWPIKGTMKCQTVLNSLGRAIIAVGLLCLVPAATLAQMPERTPGGIGGTGHQPGEGNGIGGTGAPENHSASAATGIIGTITGFGSILVNNFEIDYSPDTPAKSDLDEAVQPKSLRVGQVVEVEAEGEGRHLHARRIAVRYEAVGRIESIDRETGDIHVLGQTITSSASIIGTSRDSQSGSIGDLAVGDTVYVSGLRRADGVIAASRIDRSEAAGGAAWLRGRIDRVEAGGFVVSGVYVAQSNFNLSSRQSAGTEAAISGIYSGGMFRAARFTALPQQPFAGHVAHLSVEGYVGSRGGSGSFVGGLGIEGSGAGQLRNGERVIIDGRIGMNGRFIPATVNPAPFNRSMRERGGRSDPYERRFGREGRFDRYEHRSGHVGRGSPSEARPAYRAFQERQRMPPRHGFWRHGHNRRR